MKNIKKLLFTIVFSGVFLITPIFTSAATLEELQAQIAALLKQIAQLQTQIAQIQGQPAEWCYDFNVNLKIGDRGKKVEALFNALTKEGLTPALHAEDVTNYFGEGLASAVTGFQQKYKNEILTPLGLKYGTGYVGKATRAKLNKLYGCGIKPPVECAYPCPQYSPPAPCESGYKQVCEQVKPNVCGCYPPPSCKCIPLTEPNQPPVIHGVSGPTTLKINETGTWTVKASDPEQGILTYSVIWGDEVQAALPLMPPYKPTTYTQTATFTHSYSKAGIYTPTFTVTDDQGLSAKTSLSVKVGEVATPSITVLSPNGGEVWTIGQTKRVSWSVANVKYVRIYIEESSGTITGSGAVNYIYDGAISANQGYYYWSIQQNQLPGGSTLPRNYKIRIDGFDTTAAGAAVKAIDRSDAPFSIVAAGTPSITVLSPGAQQLTTCGSAGETCQIRVFCKNVTQLLNIILIDESSTPPSRRMILDGVSCKNAKDEYDWTIYNWTIPLDIKPAKITEAMLEFVFKIRAETLDSSIGDESDYPFRILPPLPSITVLSPNGGETLNTGTTSTIKWTSTLKYAWASTYLSDFRVKLDSYGADGYYKGTIGDVSDTGSFIWTVGEVTLLGQKLKPLSPGQYKLRITNSTPGTLASVNIFDESDMPFSIAAGGVGLKNIENQLASIANAVSQLMERMKELIAR